MGSVKFRNLRSKRLQYLQPEHSLRRNVTTVLHIGRILSSNVKNNGNGLSVNENPSLDRKFTERNYLKEMKEKHTRL